MIKFNLKSMRTGLLHISDPKEIVELVNDYYMNIVDRFHIKTKDTIKLSVNHHPDLSIKLHKFSKVNHIKVAEIITKCKSKKTDRLVGISMYGIKECSEYILRKH